MDKGVRVISAIIIFIVLELITGFVNIFTIDPLLNQDTLFSRILSFIIIIGVFVFVFGFIIIGMIESKSFLDKWYTIRLSLYLLLMVFICMFFYTLVNEHDEIREGTNFTNIGLFELSVVSIVVIVILQIWIMISKKRKLKE